MFLKGAGGGKAKGDIGEKSLEVPKDQVAKSPTTKALIGQAAVKGFVPGFGAGEGGFSNRLESGLASAAVSGGIPIVGSGAVRAAQAAGKLGKNVVSKPLEKLGEYISKEGTDGDSMPKKAISAAIDKLPKKYKNHLSVAFNKTVKEDGLDNAEKYVINQLQKSGVKSSDAKAAAAELKDAYTKNVPLGLIDSLSQEVTNEGATIVSKNANLANKGRTLFTNTDDINEAKQIIGKRVAETVDRLEKAVDVRGEGLSTKANRVKDSLTGRVSIEKATRSKEAEKAYTKAYSTVPVIKSKEVQELIRDNTKIRDSVLRVSADKDGAGKSLYEDLLKQGKNPLKNPEFLHLVKEDLKSRVDTFAKQGKNQSKRLESLALSDFSNALYKASPLIKEADTMYATASTTSMSSRLRLGTGTMV